MGDTSRAVRGSRAFVVLAATLGACSDCGGARVGMGGATSPGKSIERVGAAVQAPAAEGADGFFYAQVEKRKAGVPARFAARLPVTVEEFDGDWEAFPPRGQVSAALCAGDSVMFDRWLAAIGTAAASETISDELQERLASLVSFCGDERFCSEVVGRQAAAPAAVRAVLIQTLAECGSTDAQSAVEVRGSDEQVIDWYFKQYSRRFPEPSTRFQQAARVLVRSRRGRDLRELGVTLGRFDGGAALIQELTRELDPESRAWLGLGLRDHPSAQARALHTQACKHPAVGKDTMCGTPTRPASSAPTTPGNLAKEVLEFEFEAKEWLGSHPDRRDELLGELRGCVLARDGQDTWQRANCLRSFAALDRAGATNLVRPLGAQSLPTELRILRTTLMAFPTDAAVDEAMERWGLMKIAPRASAQKEEGPPAITVADKLHGSGRLHAFDVETGSFPNEHDVLLSELASYAGEQLRGVIFEEVAPETVETDDTFREIAPYVLRAYVNGFVLETKAENNGDWYDVQTVLGLLNTTLRELGRDFRYVTVDDDGDQIALVLGAPGPALQQAARAGLLDVGVPTQAMQSGKEFERRVLETLEPGDGTSREVRVPIE